MVTIAPNREHGFVHVVREFAAGFVVLGRGFTEWRRHPGLMALGLIPAAVVSLVLFGVGYFLTVKREVLAEKITEIITSDRHAVVATALIITEFAILASAAVLAGFAFTALTLIIGEPIYSRLWRALALDRGEVPAAHEPGFVRSILDAARLVGQAVLLAIVVGLVAFIPYVGPPIAAVAGFVLSSRIVAVELVARPLEAQGVDRAERTRLLRTRNPRVIGFGIAVHLLYIVPLGSVAVIPAAVAGAGDLARHTLHRAGRPIPIGPTPPS